MWSEVPDRLRSHLSALALVRTLLITRTRARGRNVKVVLLLNELEELLELTHVEEMVCPIQTGQCAAF